MDGIQQYHPIKPVYVGDWWMVDGWMYNNIHTEIHIKTATA